MTSSRLADGDYLVVPDLQVPYHDPKFVEEVGVLLVTGEFDGILNVGDETDSPEPARWNKGMAMEYGDTFEAGLIQTHDTMSYLDDCLRYARGGRELVHHVMRSNHADRIDKYLRKYAPAMALTSWNQYPRIMGYEQPSLLKGREGTVLPITHHDKLWEFAPGWVLAHGDEGSMSRTPGGTALSLARAIGKSVVCGHTHKAGLVHESTGYNGSFTRVLYGLEVGHGMAMGKAGYLPRGAANWQQAVGVLKIRGRRVFPELYLRVNGRFELERNAT